MLKKIALAVLFVGLIGALVAGAIIRTTGRTSLVAEARGGGYGHGQDHDEGEERDEGGAGQGYGWGNGGVGTDAVGGAGQGRTAKGAAERQYPNFEDTPDTWLEYEGAVMQVPEDGVDLVIRTDDGEELTIGTGPMYMATQGFTLQAGEQVQVRGYWEDGEFKAAQVTRLADGQTIALRDDLARPAWAGAGRNAQGNSPGGYGNQGSAVNPQPNGGEDAPGDGTGTGQAEVEEWLSLQGTVVSVDADTLVVETFSGEQVRVENRAWWFAQEQGFWTQTGHQMTLVGFYEDDGPEQHFEVGRIDDDTSGQTVLVREENGRPLWAGRGRRSGL